MKSEKTAIKDFQKEVDRSIDAIAKATKAIEALTEELEKFNQKVPEKRRAIIGVMSLRLKELDEEVLVKNKTYTIAVNGLRDEIARASENKVKAETNIQFIQDNTATFTT